MDVHGGTQAAVLAPLFVDADGALHAVFTRRRDDLSRHPGEISFPGGRRDPGETLLETALREAHEEVGLHPSRVEGVAHVVDHLTYRGGVVCAYVGRVREPPPAAPASPQEVAEVFLVPVEDLLDPASYEARRVDGMPPGRRVHYWHVKPRTVWGITGQLTAHFLERACGWAPPAEPRTVASVEDFVPRA